MHTEPSLISFVLNASFIVKMVMLLLLAASIFSWTIILQCWVFIKNAKAAIRSFEARFWTKTDVDKFYKDLVGQRERSKMLHGMEHIFHAGFSEFIRLRRGNIDSRTVLNSADRAMRVALARETDKLEQNLPFLATVGSTSPYVGLFGTVWGIMTAFRALGFVQQATISMVAPGISEALIATAMGLFAAIPAVIAYNKYVNMAGRLENQYNTFKEEFLSVLEHQEHFNCK